jgi:hypothetical protein
MAFIVPPCLPVIRDDGAGSTFSMLSKQRRARRFSAGKVHHLFYLLYFVVSEG